MDQRLNSTTPTRRNMDRQQLRRERQPTPYLRVVNRNSEDESSLGEGDIGLSLTLALCGG